MSDGIVIEVNKVEEAGYNSALLGLSFNKKKDPAEMVKVAGKLAFMDHGHNKFIESIVVWLEVKGPRYFWQEADTYRLSTKQSESTMHTLVEELLGVTINDEASVAGYMAANFEPGSCSVETLKAIQSAAKEQDYVGIKRLLPEGFLQKRIWCMSYKTLANIIIQRRHHRLGHWQSFITQVLEQVEHPEILPALKKRAANKE